MSVEGRLTLRSAQGSGLRFEARFGEHMLPFDSGPGAAAASPVQALLGALAACEAMDVISILRKKRLAVSAYEVTMLGERAPSHPRRYTSIALVHRVTGHAVPAAAVEEAVRLSEQKYCSVHASLDPAIPIHSRCEVLEG